ncbi:molybdopterin-dependent oxidoreductase [Cupriavidus sp. AU9028]|nr:molybdopterin-dependent oxidoreductase [Cupriavidus sp. AU9028]
MPAPAADPSAASGSAADAAPSPVVASVRTTCPYCGVGCGVRAERRADGSVEVAGDADHPANAGRLCVKGAALAETVDLQGRLLYPKFRQPDGTLARIDWDDALDRVAGGLHDTIARHGPDSVALYVSGQLLTEDYYVANKLMKGYIGTANIDTNSRLCMSSAVAGHKRAFGEDLVPGCYEDLELADLVVLVGSNAAWCHPILFQRIAAAKAARPQMKLVVVDPRRTATCDIADLHLPVRPGTDVWLFNGLLQYLRNSDDASTATALDADELEQALAASAGQADPAEVARACRLNLEDVLTFYRWFAATPKTVTAFSQGVNQSSAGTDKVNAIINCHLLTGRIGHPGAGPFSLTGQPNAMGGREVGGLANMLAAHLELGDPSHRELVQTFWASPAIAARPGLKAVELFDAIDQGRIKAVWVIATNPVVSLPDADLAQRALRKCELVISSDIVERSDTNDTAHILLPALGWGEKNGTVTNSERRISRQRAFLPAPGEARPDWWILAQVAQRMGYDGFGYTAPHQIFDEHARLSAWRNGDDADTSVPRVFNLAGLTGLGERAWDALVPIQWPVHRAGIGTERLAVATGARMVATAPRAPVHATDDDFPMVLNTGRVRDQWHTMTRTGKSPRLAEHLSEPFVDMHPQDALLCGVGEGRLARVTSRWGGVVVRVRHGGGIARGSVFVPIHWNGRFSSDARVGSVVNPVVDPVSGEPEFKHTPVRVDPFPVSWQGVALARGELDCKDLTWWTRATGRQFERYEFAGREPVRDRSAWARALLGVGDPEADWLEFEDRAAGIYHAAWLVDERVQACVHVSPRADLPARAWLGGLFSRERLDDLDRMGLLLGQPAEAVADVGPTVCSCFGVGRNTICDAIRKHQLTSATQITACVRAGGNCGSCVPELNALLAASRVGEDQPVFAG